jgi:hypothetical protein
MACGAILGARPAEQGRTAANVSGASVAGPGVTKHPMDWQARVIETYGSEGWGSNTSWCAPPGSS